MERFQRRAVRAEPKGTPSGTPPRGSTDASRLSEGGSGAGAPHGILAGPRQPLVPFPCGKGTRASADARNSLKPHLEPCLCAPSPHPITLPCSPSQLLSASISSPQNHKKREARRSLFQASLFGFRQRPTLPGRVQPSTIGAEGLNFCVRYGNRWYPFAIITGNCELVLFPHTLTTAQHFFDLNFLSLFPISLSDFASKSSPRPISIIKLHSLPNYHR